MVGLLWISPPIQAEKNGFQDKLWEQQCLFTQHEIFHIGIFTFWHVHWFATCAFGKSLYYRGHTASTVSHKRPFEDRTAILPNCYHTFHWTCLKPPAIVYAMLNWQQALRVKAQSKCWDEDTRLGSAAQTESRRRGWGQCCRTQCMAQWVRWASKGCPQCGTSEAVGPCRIVSLRFGTTAFPLMPLWWHRETHLHSAIQRLTPQAQSSTATAPENNSADTFFAEFNMLSTRATRLVSHLFVWTWHVERGTGFWQNTSQWRGVIVGLRDDCETIFGVYQTKVIIKVFCLGVKSNDGMPREFLPVKVTSTLRLGSCHKMINGTLFLFSFCLLLLCLSDWW